MKKFILFLFVLFSFQLLYANNDRDQRETAPPISQPVTNVFLSNVVLTNPYVGTDNDDDTSGTETTETTDSRDGKPNNSINATPTDLSSNINTVRNLSNININNNTIGNESANNAIGIETATLSAFSAYPNPVANELQVHLSLTEDTQLYLLNTLGQVVYVVLYPAYTNSVQIPVGNLSNGMYILVAETPQQRITQKIQVIH